MKKILLVVTLFPWLTVASFGWSTTFAEHPAGAFTRLEAPYGTWTAGPGRVEIDKAHARTSPNCLHILGGTDQQVELALKVPARDAVLGFWTERWTRRDPFKFRVEAYDGSTWKEIYNGDQTIRIGGFLTEVKVPLAGVVQRLRFTCTAPEKSGILIDDLRVEEAKPMHILAVEQNQMALPVLIRNRFNPLVSVRVDAEGLLSTRSVEGLRFNLDGTDELTDLASVQVLYTGSEDPLRVKHSELEEDLLERFLPFGETLDPSKPLVFRGKQTLQAGANFFVLSTVLKDNASLVHHVDAACEAVAITGESHRQVKPETRNIRQRIGYAVRKGGDDDSRAFRIPGLATTNKGSLIGVYDIRYRGWGDLPGHICVGMSRSTDGGQSWEPMQTIMDMGDHDQWRGNGIGDPAVLVDETTGTIWVVAVWSHGNRGWHGSGPGLTPEETGQLVLVRSDDDGQTWSDPINITSQVKDPDWCYLLQGPGRGITLQDGTIMFAAQYQDTPGNNRMPHATIIYSADHGKTWKVGTGAKPNTTEAQVVELSDGRLMLNLRDNRGGARSVYTTGDRGKTWTEHPTSRTALPEPVCMASLLKHPGTGWLLFSNPNVSNRPRRHMSIKVSKDDGMTWPEAWHTLADEGASAGYSCLSDVGEDRIGIFYEGSRAPMTYLVYDLEELSR